MATRLHPGFVGLCISTGIVALSWPAGAVPAHWDLMVEGYGWSGDCTLCHESASGGASTATRPFAQSLKTLGLTAQTTRDDLVGIMYVAEVLAADSDGDYFADVQELRNAGDPNDPEIGLGEFDGDEPADEGTDDEQQEAATDAPAMCAFSPGRPTWAVVPWLVLGCVARWRRRGR